MLIPSLVFAYWTCRSIAKVVPMVRERGYGGSDQRLHSHEGRRRNALPGPCPPSPSEVPRRPGWTCSSVEHVEFGIRLVHLEVQLVEGLFPTQTLLSLCCAPACFDLCLAGPQVVDPAIHTGFRFLGCGISFGFGLVDLSAHLREAFFHRLRGRVSCLGTHNPPSPTAVSASQTDLLSNAIVGERAAPASVGCHRAAA